MNCWKRVLDPLLLPEPSLELVLSAEEPRWGNAGYARYSRQGLHIVLSRGRITCFGVLGKVCMLCAVPSAYPMKI